MLIFNKLQILLIERISIFLEPQITQMTLIFKQLQIEQIYTEILNAQAHELSQISWRGKENERLRIFK